VRLYARVVVLATKSQHVSSKIAQSQSTSSFCIVYPCSNGLRRDALLKSQKWKDIFSPFPPRIQAKWVRSGERGYSPKPLRAADSRPNSGDFPIFFFFPDCSAATQNNVCFDVVAM